MVGIGLNAVRQQSYNPIHRTKCGVQAGADRLSKQYKGKCPTLIGTKTSKRCGIRACEQEPLLQAVLIPFS